MALSGTLHGSCVANNGASNRYEYKIEWSATQNVNANQSTITATAYVRCNNSNYSTSTNWTSIINGSTVKTFSYHIQASAGWVNFGSKTWTVNHNADGTCTTSISGSFSGTYNGNYVLRSGSVSGNITLNTIPRSSSFTLNRSSATIGSDAITVNINRASSSFTHTVIYSFGSIAADQATKTNATSVTFTPYLADCSQIPNSTSGTATIVVDTYNGNTKVGSSSKTITLNVPSSVVPSCGISVSGNNLLSGNYVGGKSTVTVAVTNATGSHGSTIKSYAITGGGINSSSQSATSGTLSAGSHDLTVKVTDSRGRSYSKTQRITVHSYTTPTLSANIYRTNSVGEATNEGTYVHADITVNIDNIGGANVNAKQYKVEWKAASNSNWSTLTDWTNIDKYSKTWKHILGGDWKTSTTYDIRISVKDSYSTANVIGTVGTIACLFNIERGGVGVGKVHERGSLDIGGDVYSTGSFRSTGNGKEVKVGTGRTDVFLTNSKSNKYLQLKDDGSFQYDDKRVYHEGYKPTYSDVGALPMDSPCFTGNLVQSRSGYAWIYHINADLGSLNIAPRNADGNNDWAKQFLLKRDGDVQIAKNLTVKDVFMQRCWLYDVARINAGGNFDIHATGTGINGGPLYMNGNSTIKSVLSASELPIAYGMKRELELETRSILEEVIVVSTTEGLRMIPKVETHNDEGRPQGVDLIEVISALKIENEKIKQSLNDMTQRIDCLENI